MCKSCPYLSNVIKTNVEPKIIIVSKLASNAVSCKANDLEQQVMKELSKLNIADEIKTGVEKVL
jgi:hypothetical protein